MNRQQYENLFFTIKPLVYSLTNSRPEIAHHLFINNLNFIAKHLDIEQILGFNGLEKKPLIDLAPAAGFNKNGTIHSDALYHLGFTKNVIGSVTSIKHKGNKHPRSWRIYESESLVNRLGLPGDGKDKVWDNLSYSYINAKHQLPIEINLVPHPDVVDKIKDIEYCVKRMADILFVESFTLNISCPNTNPEHRDEYQRTVVDLLQPIFQFKKPHQKVKLKVSPDMDEAGIDQILRVIEDLDVYGIETTNTTTYHDPVYIPVSPTDKPAGASGPALFHKAKKIQQLFEEKSNGKYVFDAVGGIRDIQTAEERITFNTKAIKIYTALVFQGPKIVRELRTYLNER
jgi:dihydroorotate dehydrogenase